MSEAQSTSGQFVCQTGGHSVQEFLRGDSLGWEARLHQAHQILGHHAGVEGVIQDILTGISEDAK